MLALGNSCTEISARANNDQTLIANEITFTKEPFKASGPMHSPPVKPLSADDLKRVLAKRVNGTLAYTFRQFANMFVVGSAISMGNTVGLVTASPEIEQHQLIPIFPQSYKPTLHEFLDAIGAETCSEWSYDPTNNFLKTDAAEPKPVENMPVFEFKPSSHKQTFTLEIAKDWTSNDHCFFFTYAPSIAPVGMDVYELGTYSCDDKDKEKELFSHLPTDISLEWAKRIKDSATEKDLEKRNVGNYEGVYFESMIPSKLGKDIHWRQWALMAGNRAYIVVSTILPEQEEQILPAVEAMLKTFKAQD